MPTQTFGEIISEMMALREEVTALDAVSESRMALDREARIVGVAVVTLDALPRFVQLLAEGDCSPLWVEPSDADANDRLPTGAGTPATVAVAVAGLPSVEAVRVAYRGANPR